MAVFSNDGTHVETPQRNISGTITTGGTAQVLEPATYRNGFSVFNPSTESESLFIFEFGAATTASPSIEVQPGIEYTPFEGSVSSNELSIIAATTGHKFTARSW